MRARTKFYIIKWVNRYSGETGFVGSIQKRKNHFNNADANHALCFTEAMANETIEILKTLSDATDNDYFAVNTSTL